MQPLLCIRWQNREELISGRLEQEMSNNNSASSPIAKIDSKLSTTFSKVYKILKSNNSDSSPRSKVVPIVVILAFALYGLLSFNQGLGIASVGSVFFIGLILVRRLTAPWPPDPITGDLPQKSILRILILDRPN